VISVEELVSNANDKQPGLEMDWEHRQMHRNHHFVS